MDSRESPLEPLGYQQITSLAASTALTVPARARAALIKCTAQSVRFRDDGTAPTATVGFPLDTTDGLLATGRITTGHGRVGTGCSHRECRGKDAHACDYMTLAQTLAHYDRLRTVANVCAHEYDGVGIWAQGILAADADEQDLAVLDRRQMSGHWYENCTNQEMIELLALARERPGFPIPHAAMRNGRMVSLTAAGARPPTFTAGLIRPVAPLRLDYGRLGDAVADSRSAAL